MCLNLNRKHLCSERSKYLMRVLKTTITAFYRRAALPLRPEKDCLLHKERDFYIFNV